MESFIEELCNLLQYFGNVSNIILTKEIKQCSVHLNLNSDLERVLSLINEHCEYYSVYYDIDYENFNIIKCTFWYNACVFCDSNLGFHNPRQLCRKTYCPEQLQSFSDTNTLS